MVKRVLVVPAGTENGHEIFECLKYSKHWEVYSASGARDHSEVIFERNVRFDLPFAAQADFLPAVQQLVDSLEIDYVIPAHDDAIFALAGRLNGAALVGPNAELASVLRFKSRTLSALKDAIPTPRSFTPETAQYPVFCKPDRGQGSRGATIVRSHIELMSAMEISGPLAIQEVLPGDEVTVDCFSTLDFNVIFCGARKRERISGGIATRVTLLQDAIFHEYASIISKALKLSGAWFYQMKQDSKGQYRLLEVSNRLAGTSGIHRAIGINLLDAWLHLLEGKSVSIVTPPSLSGFVYDRALYPKLRIANIPKRIYVDFDDTLILPDGRLNHRLVGALFGLKSNKGVLIYLITRHDGEVDVKVQHLGLSGLFEKIIHLRNREDKSSEIEPEGSLMIDDSFREREEVTRKLGILCLPPESIEYLEGCC